MRCLVYSVNGLFGQCLASSLAAHARVEAADFCAELDQVLSASARLDASSTLVDLAYPEGRLAVQQLARGLNNRHLVGLSIDETATGDVLDCARIGCTAVVPRDASLEELVCIVRAAERGEALVHPRVAAGLMRALSARPEPAPDADTVACLTRREREVCALICDGMTNKEIALEVNRSVGTVKNHVRSILGKFNLSRRTAVFQHVHRSELMGHTHRTSAPSNSR